MERLKTNNVNDENNPVKELFSLHTPADDDPNPEKFDSELHLKLVQAQQSIKEERSFFSTIFRPALFTALTATLLFVVFLSLDKSDEVKPYEPQLISETEVEPRQPVKITVEYEAERDINNVTVRFSLGKGVSFHSNSSKIKDLREYLWKGNLNKGINKIPFIVDVEKIGTWEIDTVANFEGLHHKHKILLNATEEKIIVAYYKFPETEI